MRAALDSEFDGRIKVRNFCQQKANAIDAMKAGDDPLVKAYIPVHDSPYMVFVVLKSQPQVVSKCFKSMPTPYIKTCRRMSEWAEMLVKNVFVKNGGFLHSDIPIR